MQRWLRRPKQTEKADRGLDEELSRLFLARDQRRPAVSGQAISGINVPGPKSPAQYPSCWNHGGQAGHTTEASEGESGGMYNTDCTKDMDTTYN